MLQPALRSGSMGLLDAEFASLWPAPTTCAAPARAELGAACLVMFEAG
jgi:hypothetical protein